MSYNLKQAFTFVWSDADFFTKWAIGSFILVFPTLSEWFPGIKRMFSDPANYGWLFVFAVIALIAELSVKGYFYKAVHNHVVHDAQKLPDWRCFWTYTKNGLKAYIGGFLFMLPYLCAAAGLYYYFRPDHHSLHFVLTCIGAMILFAFIYLPFSLNFATRLRISAFFNYKRAFWLLKGRVKEYIMLYVYCVLIGIGATLVSALISLNGLTSILLPFFGFYIVMVYAALYAQFLNMPSAEKP